MNTLLYLLSLHSFSSEYKYGIGDLMSYYDQRSLRFTLMQETIEIDSFIQYTKVFRKRLLFLRVCFSKAPIGSGIKILFYCYVIKPIFWENNDNSFSVILFPPIQAFQCLCSQSMHQLNNFLDHENRFPTLD